MSDDMWENLFAQAADLGSSSTAPTTITSNDTKKGSHKSKNLVVEEEKGMKKNKKRKRRDTQHEENQNNNIFYMKMIENRMRMMDPSSKWSVWWTIGEGFLPDSYKIAKRYNVVKTSTSPPTDNPTEESTYGSCTGESPFLHRLQVVNGVDGIHSLFQLIRNLRCIAGILAKRYIPTTQLVPSPSSYEITIRKELHEQDLVVPISASKPSLFKGLPEEEVEILSKKLDCVIDYAHRLHNGIESESRKKGSDICNHWDNAVRLVIACDNLYYRLYYLQLIQAIPICQVKNEPSKDNNNKTVCFFPHPLEYFSLTGLAMNSTKMSMTATTTTTTTKEQDDRPNTKQHPLERLHYLRQHETKIVFETSGWISKSSSSSSDAQREMIRSLYYSFQKTAKDDLESQHTTPAPKILMEWRDGCRDFLCNLYAYATISSSVLNQMVSFLKNYVKSNSDPSSATTIMEIGAGTGYVAKLLQDRGLSVEAWDIHPPNDNNSSHTINEYHGQTPTFVPVQKCSRIPTRGNSSSRSTKNKILMLSYPPPDSSMAFDTLKEFLEGGGTCLIHIGEFKGLTGKASFEELLVKNLTCYFRESCLTWGTDASHVTIWIKGTVSVDEAVTVKGSKLLLPCTYCGKQEAILRCRLARDLVYCSAECFDADAPHIDKVFRSVCIPFRANQLQFTNDKHFKPL